MDMSCLPQVGGGSPNAAEGATESPLTPLFGSEALDWGCLPGRPPGAPTPGGQSVEGPRSPEPFGLGLSRVATDVS
jgi:hypothetical protein